MAQLATITVFDGASTPVSHSLPGVEVLREGLPVTTKAIWREQIAGLPEGAQLTLTQLKKKLPSGVSVHISRVEVPVMEQASGVNAQGYTAPPKVAYTDTFELVSKVSARSTEVTKRIAMQVLINWISNTSSTQTPISLGWAADLHQRGIQAT
jgi:hypothetical protein